MATNASRFTNYCWTYKRQADIFISTQRTIHGQNTCKSNKTEHTGDTTQSGIRNFYPHLPKKENEEI
jgi:hypothetical protein